VVEGGVTTNAGEGKELGRAISSAVRQELLNQKRAGGLLVDSSAKLSQCSR